jgi:hypothetical protein
MGGSNDLFWFSFFEIEPAEREKMLSVCDHNRP